MNLWNVPNPMVDGAEPVVPKPTLPTTDPSDLNESLCSTLLRETVAWAPLPFPPTIVTLGTSW